LASVSRLPYCEWHSGDACIVIINFSAKKYTSDICDRRQVLYINRLVPVRLRDIAVTRTVEIQGTGRSILFEAIACLVHLRSSCTFPTSHHLQVNMFNPTTLWTPPVVNPINHKARSIPGLNPINVYGRVFFFSWFGFMIAFWSWYAFPPLVSTIERKGNSSGTDMMFQINVTIKKDLKLSKIEIANSNIIALTATLLVRLIAGPACDRFGPRRTFAGCLLVGAIPTFLSGTAYTASELYALRFFIGILGGSFVPCQVWMTGFFDKNIVGTGNAFAAGFGNAGGGITYFLMPAIYDSLVKNQHLSAHVAWRVSFVVPGICIVAVALGLLLLCPDTPTGKWADRHLAVQQNLAGHGINATVVDTPAGVMDKKSGSGFSTPPTADEKMQFDATGERKKSYDNEAVVPEQEMLDTARGEVVQKPTFKEAMHVIFSMQTLVTAACYFCSFGTELSVNSILGAYYLKNFKTLGQTGSGNWAAMFG
jgi:NNP family nitrate/nitrite transporter-like MFS transporter